MKFEPVWVTVDGRRSLDSEGSFEYDCLRRYIAVIFVGVGGVRMFDQ